MKKLRGKRKLKAEMLEAIRWYTVQGYDFRPIALFYMWLLDDKPNKHWTLEA